MQVGSGCLSPLGSLQALSPSMGPVSSREFAGFFHGGSRTRDSLGVLSPESTSRALGGLSPRGSLQVGSGCLSPRGSLQVSPPPTVPVSSREFASFFHGGSRTRDASPGRWFRASRDPCRLSPRGSLQALPPLMTPVSSWELAGLCHGGLCTRDVPCSRTSCSAPGGGPPLPAAGSGRTGVSHL